MKIDFWPIWYFAPEGAGGGGEGAGGGDEGAGGEGAAKWYEGETFTDDDRTFLTKKGLATDDPNAPLATILKGWRSAEQKLGKPPETMMDRPAEGQSVAEFLKQNGDVFQIPDAPDGYEIDKGELPKGVQWDEGLEAKARAVAHENGIGQAGLQSMVALFTEHQVAEAAKYADDAASAEQSMRAELVKDWGAEYGPKVELARRALAHFGEVASLPPEVLMDASAALEEKAGSPSVMKLFAAIGEMVGEDSLITAGAGGAFASTPAAARQELAEMQEPGSDYQKALSSGNRQAIDRFTERRKQLTKIATGGK